LNKKNIKIWYITTVGTRSRLYISVQLYKNI